MMENEKAKSKDLVIDVGATTYQPLYSYLIKNDVFNLLSGTSTYTLSYVFIPGLYTVQ
jgi:hypothetical protein